MTDKADDFLTRLPARLKEARTQKGLSLEAVANLSGVSRSMVSQIERGESSPTISTLWNLTNALQVDFAGLVDTAGSTEKIAVLKDADVPVIDKLGEGCKVRILSPPEEAGGHEVYDIRLEAQGTLNSRPHARGAREQLTVMEGSVRVVSGPLSEYLGQGDTARYAADVPHSITAQEGPARLFLIVKGA